MIARHRIAFLALALVGAALDLFSTHSEAGAGFVFWHPKMGAVRREMEGKREE